MATHVAPGGIRRLTRSTAARTPPDDPPARMASVETRRRHPTTQSRSETRTHSSARSERKSSGRLEAPGRGRGWVGARPPKSPAPAAPARKARGGRGVFFAAPAPPAARPARAGAQKKTPPPPLQLRGDLVHGRPVVRLRVGLVGVLV